MDHSWPDEDDDDKPTGELSEDEARAARYADDGAKKLTRGGGLDEEPSRLNRRLILGTGLAVILALGGGVAWAAKTKGSNQVSERDTLKRLDDKPMPVPDVFKNVGDVPPMPEPKDDYDKVDPNDPAFTTPVTAAPPEQKFDELNCPAEYTPGECVELERRRLAGEPINKVQRPTYATSAAHYAASPRPVRPGSDSENWEDYGLAPMGYYGPQKASAPAPVSMPATEAAMGMQGQPGLSLPPNLTKALEQAAQGQGAQDGDDVKERFAANAQTLDAEDTERELAECELTAGTVIHVANLSAINTDVPAKSSVTAQVTRTVYCGSDEQHVAIPQGSVFTASANARVQYGDNRIQLCMEQLRRPASRDKPNGSVLPVKCWAAADITGMIGWDGEVDNHWSQLIAGVALSALLSVGTTAAAGNQEGFAPTIAQRAASQAGMQLNQAGTRIVQRDLQRKPTITRAMLQSASVVVTHNQPMKPWKARKARKRTW